jgi:hypothetical protein
VWKVIPAALGIALIRSLQVPSALEPVAIHGVFPFQLPDTRFDGSPAFHPVPRTAGLSPAATVIKMHLSVTDAATPRATRIDKGISGEPGDGFDLLVP